jgi:hypothetical protein
MTKARTTSPLTRTQKNKRSEVPSEVKLRKIVPEVPQDETEDEGGSGFGFKDESDDEEEEEEETQVLLNRPPKRPR